MNRIRWYNPLTGEMLATNYPQSKMRGPQGKHVVDINKVCIYMWSKGYIRGGKHVVLTDIEKKLIATADEVRKEMYAANPASRMEHVPATGLPFQRPPLQIYDDIAEKEKE